MIKTVLILALAIAIASSASGQVPSKPFSLYLQGGASLPQDSFKDDFKMGYHGAGGLGFSIFPKVEAIGRVSYHKHSLETPIDGIGDLTLLMYGADIKMNLGALGTNPYVLGGYGWVKNELEPFPSVTDNYWVIGGGIEFGKTIIEGRYITFIEDDENESDDDSEAKMITVSIGFKL